MNAYQHRSRAMIVGFFLLGYASSCAAAELSGEEIVKHCYYKYAGEDQSSRLVITLSDENGKSAKSEYMRLWKNYDGKDGIADKVILFGESPLDIRGVNFMRWGYTAQTGKLADQWVYLPEMNRVRRIAQRDPDNMDWGYTDEDLRIRDLEEDQHRFKEIVHSDGEDFYVVESIPHHDSAYSKWVTRFSKTADWKDCAPRQVDYFDKNGELIKQQFITWKRLNGAWVWDNAVMHNLRSNVSATYQMLDTRVNVGLGDRIFSERQLRRGYPGP